MGGAAFNTIHQPRARPAQPMNMARRGRSRGFWIWGFVFLFLLHAFAILRYGERQKNDTPWQRPPPFLYVGGDPVVDERMAQLSAAADPTLFALPHPNGFSGGAWLNFQPDLPRLTNWTASPEWLALPTQQLGETLAEYVATNRPSDALLLASLRAPRILELRLASEPILTNTTAHVTGPVTSRKLLAHPSLPPVAHTDALKSTVVGVAVNGEGVVESAWLSNPSGLAAADDRAVQLARLFQFEPAPMRQARAREAATPLLGRIAFTWQVLPPTNGLSAATGREGTR